MDRDEDTPKKRNIISQGAELKKHGRNQATEAVGESQRREN